jgi:hypothetical protein
MRTMIPSVLRLQRRFVEEDDSRRAFETSGASVTAFHTNRQAASSQPHLRIFARYMLRMLTARAATSPTVRNDAIDSISIRVLMRTLSGMASVGLNALAFVNATYR